MRTSSRNRGLLAVAGLAAILAAAAHAQEHAAHWSYSGAHGPDHWGAEDPAFAACSAGIRQSPIDIETATTAARLPRDRQALLNQSAVCSTARALSG